MLISLLSHSAHIQTCLPNVIEPHDTAGLPDTTEPPETEAFFTDSLWAQVRLSLAEPNTTVSSYYQDETMASDTATAPPANFLETYGIVVLPLSVKVPDDLSRSMLAQPPSWPELEPPAEVMVSKNEADKFAHEHMAIKNDKALKMNMYRYLAKPHSYAPTPSTSKDKAAWHLQQHWQQLFKRSSPLWTTPPPVMLPGRDATKADPMPCEIRPECTYWLGVPSNPSDLRPRLGSSTLLANHRAVYPYMSIDFVHTVTTPDDPANMMTLREAVDETVVLAGCIALWNRFVLRERASAKEDATCDVDASSNQDGDAKTSRPDRILNLEQRLVKGIAFHIVLVSKNAWEVWQLTPRVCAPPRHSTPCIFPARLASSSTAQSLATEPATTNACVPPKYQKEASFLGTAPRRLPYLPTTKSEQEYKADKRSNRGTMLAASGNEPLFTSAWAGCNLRRVAFSSCDEASDLGELAAWVNRVHAWAREVYGQGVKEDYEVGWSA